MNVHRYEAGSSLPQYDNYLGRNRKRQAWHLVGNLLRGLYRGIHYWLHSFVRFQNRIAVG
jgi:hypothetical protein